MESLLSSADYNQLRAFVAVGECLSFSRAAELLGVSPSALSQMLRGFEERIGVRLLNRTTRSVALDMKDQANVELFLRLAATADVIVENYGPGVMRRWTAWKPAPSSGVMAPLSRN